MPLIDPLSSFPNSVPQMENTSIFVSLTIKERGRSIITLSQTGLQVDKKVGTEVNFLGFDVTTGQYSTKWSELTGPHISGDEGSKFEGFGMTNINIKTNTSYIPSVDITFIDLRGSSLFSIGQDSKYATLFSFPPPEFTLTVKGYFGKSLTYGLHLVKQSSKFNSKTGNFEITANFVAVTFAPLTDIPVAYLKVAPFMENQDRNTDPNAGSVDTFYELINASRVLNKNIERLKQGDKFQEFVNLGDDILKINLDLKELQNFDFLIEQSYRSTVFSDKKVTINRLSKETGGDRLIFTDKTGNYQKTSFNQDLDESFFKDFRRIGNGIENEFNREILSIIKNNLTDGGISNEIVITSNFSLPSSGGTATLVGQISGISTQLNNLRNLLINKRDKRQSLCDEIKTDVDDLTISALGFKPTIYNVFRIILNDVDRFIKLLRQSSINAQKDISGISKLLQNSDAKVSDESSSKNQEIVRYSWPEYFESKTILNGKSKKNVRTYPGSNPTLRVMSEVQFVENFIESSIEIIRGERSRRELDDKDDEGNVDWTPLGPFEDVHFEGSSDYGRNKTSVDNLLGVLVRRSQIIVNWNLRHIEQDGFFGENIALDRLIGSFGVLEGDNILHEVQDPIILRALGDLNENNFENMLNLSDTSDEFLPTIPKGTPAIDLFNQDNLDFIEFRHTGEESINRKLYRLDTQFGGFSVFKIQDNFSFEPVSTVKSEVENIKQAAEEGGFVSLFESIFNLEDDSTIITDENKVVYKDTQSGPESNFFISTLDSHNDISNFKLPPRDFFNDPNIITDEVAFDDSLDRVETYSRSVLEPVFKTADSFLLNLTSNNSNAYTEEIASEDPSAISSRSPLRFISLNGFVENRRQFLPGIIEIPYLLLVYYGWIITTIEGNGTFGIESLTKEKIFDDNEKSIEYFINLPPIVRDQLVEQYELFRDQIFGEVKDRILVDQTASTLELRPDQFEVGGNSAHWGGLKSGVDSPWWELVMSRKYLFVGLPLVLISPEKSQSTLNINPISEQENRQSKVQLLISSTIKHIKTKVDMEIKEKEEVEEDIKSSLKDNDIKLAFYNSFKTISDRWLSGGFSLFDSKNSTEQLIDKFSFVDRAMKDIGILPEPGEPFNDLGMIIDFSAVEEASENSSMSLYTLIDRLLVDNGFQFFPIQNFMLFDGQDSNSFNESNVFGFNPNIEISSSPKFLCVYIDSASSFLDSKRNESDDVFGNDGFSLEGTGVPEDLQESLDDGSVNAFKVEYGKPEQSMFKDISLNQAEFKESIEAIKILDKISQVGSEDASAKTILKGQNLFNVYEQRSYTCEVESLGNAMIQPTQYFELVNVPMFRGAYMIIEVNHTITNNQMMTKFKGIRIPRNSLPVISDFASAVGFDLCDDVSIINGSESTNLRKIDTTIVSNEVDGSVRQLFNNPVELKTGISITSIPGNRNIKSDTTSPSNSHKGVDIAMPVGTQILSAADGVIEISKVNSIITSDGKRQGFGLYVVIKHIINPDGRTYWSLYGHLTKLGGSISVGKKVKKGQVIGFSGGLESDQPNAGGSTGPHLHYEIKRSDVDSTYFAGNTEFMNPTLFKDIGETFPYKKQVTQHPTDGSST
ncbi:hypothetical protein COB55_03540 [Candidatus Wolfebacteria bacterium]|nr:MAG: hypothetical protein COB55_03540 [Candidatus Wolfebacteria bacterium]